jgi:DNA/RNA-binding domain of Phe-tRNA-synthetase-like protein
MKIKFELEIEKAFPELLVDAVQLTGVKVEKEREELEAFKSQVLLEIKKDYNLEGLKDAPIIRMYRDFFWRAGIDPTKIRPASEALIRRVLKGRSIPRINTLVDSYNLASMKTNMSLAAFDLNSIQGDLNMRFADVEEKFLGIGMENPLALSGNEPIITDSDKIIAVYPYRDSDATKVTLDTRDTLLLVCGVPGITEPMMRKASRVVSDYITRFCGGEIQD